MSDNSPESSDTSQMSLQAQQAAQQAAAAAQHAAHQAHQDAIQAALAAQTAAANQQNVALQAANSSSARPILGKLLNKPTEYDGKDRIACNTFIAQLKLYMLGNPESFPNDESKVLFAATYLRGRAFSWLEPRMLKGQDPMLFDFELFCRELQRNLGDPDQAATMARRLKALRQTTSATAYRSEFDSITQYLDWDESALKSYFYDGLASGVKDAIALIPDPPTGYKDYQDLACKIDTRLYERKQETRGSFQARPTPVASPPRFKSNNSPPRRPMPQSRPVFQGQPMDLDASRSKRKFKPLTPQERTRRISMNLCLYCGGAGHRAGECPQKSHKPARIHATLTAPPAVSKN